MTKKFIKLFAFHDLKLPSLFDLVDLLIDKVLPPGLAKELELGTPYDNLKESHGKMTNIFLRNPAMRQTKTVTDIVTKVRRKMTLFQKNLTEMRLAATDGERLETVTTIEHIAHPYIKNIYHGALTGVAAKGKDMANALRTKETLPKLKRLGLKKTVDDIATLSSEANSLLYSRGEETAFRKALGTATKVRVDIERQLRFLLYTIFPAYSANSTGTKREKFEQAILEINGTLDIYRHLTKGNNIRSSVGDNDGVPVDPTITDTQPAFPAE
jgi:hypothetical protein